MNLPDYNFLSAPLWLITVLHIVTFTLHLVAMNFMVGGIIIVLNGSLNGRRDDSTVEMFIKMFPTIMAATVTLGVAPLLFLQLVYGRQVYAASIVSGWFWIMIFAVVIVCYYCLYIAAFRGKGRKKLVNTCLSIALICFFYISFVYSSVFSMAEHPDLYKALYTVNQSGMVINPDIGSYFLRWLHMLTGAVMVGGFFIGLAGKESEEVFGIGRVFYIGGMIITMAVGLGYIFTFGNNLVPFMKSPATPLLLVSITLSLGSLFYFLRKNFLPSGMMLLVSFAGMVYVRHLLRVLNLKDYFDPAMVPIKSQWLFFTIFLVCFIIAIALIVYMLKLFFQTDNTNSDIP